MMDIIELIRNYFKPLVSVIMVTMIFLKVWKIKKHYDFKNYLKRLRIEDLPKDDNFDSLQPMFKLKDYPYIFPPYMKKSFFMMRNFEARKDDVFIISFCKSGAYWMETIVEHLFNFDLGFRKSRILYIDFPHPKFEALLKKPGRRILNTDLPYEILPKSAKEQKCKIICIAQNPKDTLVSHYHFQSRMPLHIYKGTFKHLCEIFMKDQSPYSPYWKQVIDYWNRRHDGHVLFIKYEELEKDSKFVIKHVAKFLEKNVSDEQVAQLAEYYYSRITTTKTFSMENFQLVPQGYKHSEFISCLQKSEVGDWRNYFTVNLNDKIDEWIQKYSKNTDLLFNYDL